MQLDASSWQRAADLAQRLGVSERTVYRDMHDLVEAGVPLQGVPGKGYRLPDAYLLDPVTLTSDEAVMLVLGSAYAAQNFDDRYRAAARSARRKLRERMPAEAEERAFSLQGSVQLVPPSVFGNPAEETLLRTIRRALLEERAVRLRRKEPGAGAAASLRPYGLVRHNATWRIVGLITDPADGPRRVASIRLDDVAHLQLTDATFERPSGYRTPSGTDEMPRDRTVRVVFSAEAAPLVQAGPSMQIEDTSRTPDGRLVLTLRVFHELEVMPWLLSWGSHVRVLAPQALSQRLATEARAVARQYHQLPALLDAGAVEE